MSMTVCCERSYQVDQTFRSAAGALSGDAVHVSRNNDHVRADR